MFYEQKNISCCFPQIVFVFASAYEPDNVDHGSFIAKHGDGVKDVAFEVDDLDVIFNRAKERGAVVIRETWQESDEFGTVRFATIKTVSIFFYFLKDIVVICPY